MTEDIKNGKGTVYLHVKEIVIDKINRYNKERFVFSGGIRRWMILTG